MEYQKILENLFDKKMITLIKLFLRKRDQQFYLKEISKQTKIPLASTHRLLTKLVELEIISKTKIKHLTIYQLADNERTRFLTNMFEEKKTIIDEFVENVSKMAGVNTIILYGREEKDKANVLILGEGIDNNAIRESIVSIREKYNFTITHLVLTEVQYEQMAAMNLYPGKKDILFDKSQTSQNTEN